MFSKNKEKSKSGESSGQSVPPPLPPTPRPKPVTRPTPPILDSDNSLLQFIESQFCHNIAPGV